jgi:Protein of unknown function (DUF1203)
MFGSVNDNLPRIGRAFVSSFAIVWIWIGVPRALLRTALAFRSASRVAKESEIGWAKARAGLKYRSEPMEDIIMHFRIQGLPAEQFAPLFALSDTELAKRGAVRQIADAARPCRISLTDADLGDELILVNYEHHAVASPYRMRFAIYVRRDEKTFDAVDTVPEQLRKRTLAVRGFDTDGMMTGWELVEGAQLESVIEKLLTNPRAAYLHVHFAAPGCYAARIERA